MHERSKPVEFEQKPLGRHQCLSSVKLSTVGGRQWRREGGVSRRMCPGWKGLLNSGALAVPQPKNSGAATE